MPLHDFYPHEWNDIQYVQSFKSRNVKVTSRISINNNVLMSTRSFWAQISTWVKYAKSRRLYSYSPSFILCIALPFHHHQLLNLILHWQWRHEKPTTLTKKSSLRGACSLWMNIFLLQPILSTAIVLTLLPVMPATCDHHYQVPAPCQHERKNEKYKIGSKRKGMDGDKGWIIDNGTYIGLFFFFFYMDTNSNLCASLSSTNTMSGWRRE